jgi:hypothetical protein
MLEQWKMEDGRWKRGVLPLPRNAGAMENGRWKMENQRGVPAAPAQWNCLWIARSPNLILWDEE